jgi:predicted house-cleaning noncanonical NTP pyrophosphatase (MazG superfamily)
MRDVLHSESTAPIPWSDVAAAKAIYGSKGGGLASLPRAWTPPFILVSSKRASALPEQGTTEGMSFWDAVRKLLAVTGKLTVRSSVIGETIWDRGKYKSVTIDATASGEIVRRIAEACTEVVESAGGRETGLVLQSYVEPRQSGEFGNLLRISKTRDQWELTTHEANGTATSRLNTQRDSVASDSAKLAAKSRLPVERLFGSIAAWINNQLIHGHSLRFNCEWVSDGGIFYIVQIDSEDEDLLGVNPLQLAISPIHKPTTSAGCYIKSPDASAIAEWDKLRVLEELWGPEASNRPHLYFAPLSDIPLASDPDGQTAFVDDFARLLGPDNIVVRTSIKAGRPKSLNLPRTDCLTPAEAADWCIKEKARMIAAGKDVDELAFVTHRYIDSRASAWARADPSDPSVEIHALWGLPDALQYCPYDIWEVHVPTDTATEYPEYKSNILLARPSGEWEYERVKNEIARSLSISRKDALDIARRTLEIANRLRRPCHVMWFVGCIGESGQTFNLPWYWTEAHQAQINTDRARHLTVIIKNREGLSELREAAVDKGRLMIRLRPDDPDLFRDNAFLMEVAQEASAHSMPIDLEGSTLAHAYYQLIARGCTVIARGEKDYSRTRKLAPFGKIVRDKIPDKIAARRELEATISVPTKTKLAFLIGKIVEEAIEVRESETIEETKIELADLLEIIRAFAEANGLKLADIIGAADAKKEKLGGFDTGKILLQTAIGAPRQTELSPNPNTAQVLSRPVSSDTKELPFTFFGFAELEQPRSLRFEDFGISLELTLKSDRLVVRVVRDPEQLELPFSLEVEGRDPK